MRYSLIALSCLAPSVLGLALERRACNADNCLRAVTGTALGTSRLSSIASECSSFFSVTVTPATTTVYSAVATSYLFSTLSQTLPTPASFPSGTGSPTTVTATAVPVFASAACNGNTTPIPVRFSSACSCAGITHATTTVPSPVSTVGYTTTFTVSSFLLLASGTPLPSPKYLELSTYEFGNEDSNTLTFTTDIAVASIFSLTGQQLALVGGLLSDGDPAAITEPLFFDTNQTIQTNGYAPVHVAISQSLAVTLQNSVNGNKVVQACGVLLDVGPIAGGTDVFGNACGVVKLAAVPL